MHSMLGNRVVRVLPFGFDAAILYELRGEVSARREIGQHAPCGPCELAGRAHLECLLVLVELERKQVSALHTQASPNRRRQNDAAPLSHVDTEAFVGHEQSVAQNYSSRNRISAGELGLTMALVSAQTRNRLLVMDTRPRRVIRGTNPSRDCPLQLVSSSAG